MSIEHFVTQIFWKNAVRPPPENCKLVAIPERGAYRYIVENILQRKVGPVKEGHFHARLDEEDFEVLEFFNIPYEVMPKLK